MLVLLYVRCFIFITNFIYVHGFGMNLIEVPEEDKSQVVCTIALLQKYFNSGEYQHGFVLSMSISSTFLNIQENLLRALHANSSYPWSVVVRDPKKKGIKNPTQTVLHEKPQCYFVILENLEDEDLEDVFQDWKETVNWNPLAQFVVYLASIEETDEEMTELMIEILLSFMNKKIYNVNVIGQNEENVLYYGRTAFPYNPDNNCGNRVIAVETLDICDYQDKERDENEKDYEETESSNEYLSNEGGENDGGENEDGNDNTLDNRNETEMTVDSNEFENNRNSSSENSFGFSKLITNESSTLEFPRIIVEEISNSSFSSKFPNDLNGCPLVVAYRPWEPYIMSETESITYKEEIEENSHESDFEGSSENTFDDMTFTGIEYKMVQTISEHLHLTINMQVENKNLYQLFQQLIDGDIELIFGGIDEDPSISQFVSSTIPYYQDDLTWCVAKAKKRHNLFNFLASFKMSSWLLTIAFILITSIATLKIQKLLNIRIIHFQGYFATTMRVSGIILSQSVQLKRLPTALKLLFGSTFFMGLMFSNVYQSFLVSTLTTPRSSYQISHLFELYDHKMSIRGNAEHVRHLNKDGEIFKYIRQKFEMCLNIEDCLNDAVNDINLAVAVSRQHYLYNPRIPRDRLYCFNRDENLYVYLVTMLMPKKFHLLHKINPVIQHIIESGIMQKWERDLVTERNKKYHNDPNEKTFRGLNLSQVGGSFLFAAVLLLFALGVFLLEVWVYWMVRKRKTRLIIVKRLHIKLN
ncbi:uncharacterized protein LOC119674560 [Teleopsis dalmanni]|uniref:uncharacterized protein LOC119674560 n=1 Tax=Teleopsis dalmanni TaxID=139649 RepID=UPI0018CE42A6|nr:uncharacterized protein LOC119674560 [Teleopsis dalmanni]